MPTYSESLKASVAEESPPGTFVLNVAKAASKLKNRWKETSSGQSVQYELMDAKDSRFFRIDSTTGILQTSALLDRERLCSDPSVKTCCDSSNLQHSDRCVLQLVIIERAGDLNKQYFIAVTLIDNNDHAPSFSPLTRTISIPEDAPIGTEEIFEVSDPDSSENSVVRAQIQTTDSKVASLFHVKRISSQRISLTTLSRFDSRSNSLPSSLAASDKKFQLQILAVDGGIPPLTGTLNLNVEIIDVNNHPPQWIKTPYVAKVSENAKVSTVICKLEATDLDEGLNSQIQYAIDPQRASLSPYFNRFLVDSNSGEIQLMTSFDYESGPILIELPVIAKDCGEKVSHTISTTVTIHILDYNDNKPVVSIVSLGRERDVSVMENKVEGLTIATVFVSDPDTGEGGKVTCRTNNEDFELRKLDNDMMQSYGLVTLRSFDRERQSQYVFPIMCEDRGDPRLSSETMLSVEIIDENDNPPLLQPMTLHVAIKENNRLRERLGQLNATDLDSGMNARLYFWLPDPAKTWCEISPDTGILYATIMFDREKKASYTSPIYVRDYGVPPQTATGTISVTVLDENDHEPRFLGSFYFAVNENVSPGHEVGTVQAIDEDLDENRRISYHLGQFSAEFQLHPQTGKVTVKQVQLDRERRENYELIVIAQDGGRPLPKTARTTVHITVEDLNDESPRWIFPNRNNTVVNVSCDEPINNVIARMQATDADKGLNAEIEYNLLPTSTITYSGNVVKGESSSDQPSVKDTDHIVRQHFDIDPQSGQILLLHRFPYCLTKLTSPQSGNNLLQEYRLDILAQDQGIPRRSSMVTLLIRVVEPSLRPRSSQEDGENETDGGFIHRVATQRPWMIILGLGTAAVLMFILLAIVLLILKRRQFYEEPNKASQHYFTSFNITRNGTLKHMGGESSTCNNSRNILQQSTSSDERIAFNMSDGDNETMQRTLSGHYMGFRDIMDSTSSGPYQTLHTSTGINKPYNCNSSETWRDDCNSYPHYHIADTPSTGSYSTHNYFPHQKYSFSEESGSHLDNLPQTLKETKYSSLLHNQSLVDLALSPSLHLPPSTSSSSHTSNLFNLNKRIPKSCSAQEVKSSHINKIPENKTGQFVALKSPYSSVSFV